LYCPPSTQPRRIRGRITRASDFAHLRASESTFRVVGLTLAVARSDQGVSRLGIIVPKHGKTAVERNRLKRRLREIVRAEDLPQGADVVIRAGPKAYAMSFRTLQDRVRELCGRAVASRA
jgi:ribonuclease P protein component